MKPLLSERNQTHLTYTGPNAGQTLCGAPRGEHQLHASYAPLHLPHVRETVCRACLATWLAFAYEAEDPLPFPTTVEEVAEIEKAIPQEFASDDEVAAFREKLRKAFPNPNA